MPETGGSKWSFLSDGHPVVMLCQGMDFVFSNSDFLTDEPGAYPGWPQATAAITISDAIHTFLDRACHHGFPLHNVPVQIEDWFQSGEKEKRIALMPRRRREDLLGAVQLVRRSGRLGDWQIVLIDGMTQQQVADELGRAAIFLFGAEREGVGLPGRRGDGVRVATSSASPAMAPRSTCFLTTRPSSPTLTWSTCATAP